MTTIVAPTKFSFLIGSVTQEFIVIGMEPEHPNIPCRILAKRAEDAELEAIYVFYALEGKLENMKFIKKYT